MKAEQINCDFCGENPRIGEYRTCRDHIHLQFVSPELYEELKANREKRKGSTVESRNKELYDRLEDVPCYETLEEKVANYYPFSDKRS